MNSTSTLKIFLVDDDPFCQAMYEQHLQNLGFNDIYVFSSGTDLLNSLNQKPDLVFLDYNLDDYKGTDLLAKIKEHNPETFVVIVSGQSDMEITVSLMNKGAFDYIVKDDNETEKISTVIGKWLSAIEITRHLKSTGDINPAEKYLNVIVEAQEKVRKEISNELHDNVSQLLGASKLYIETACTDERNRLQLMQESQNIINTAIKEIRKISHSLQSVFFKSTTLEEEVNQFISGLKKQHTFKLTTAVSIKGINDCLSSDVQHNIIRILQEQMNNIIKYADAKNVCMEVKKTAEEIILKINDDGIGFELEKAKRGLGLTNIFNRVAAINGICLIKTAPGQGCTWNIRIPLHLPVNHLALAAM
jgi:signal transduction histidine kinase